MSRDIIKATHHDKHLVSKHELQCEPYSLHEKQTVLPQHIVEMKQLLPTNTNK